MDFAVMGACVCSCVHTQPMAVFLRGPGLKAEVDHDLASPMALYLLVNHAGDMLKSLLLFALLLAPLKSAKSHVALVPLMEGGLYHEGTLSRWWVSFLTL